jgi:hypothetical protein
MNVIGKIPKKHLSAINFFADNLFTPQRKRHICLHIKYRKKMDVSGLVSIEGYNVLGTPNEFIIEVLKNTEEEMLKTLAHEMTHVLQYVKNELNEDMSIWRGRKVNSDEISYDEQPWEQEAMRREKELYESFLASQTR